MGDEIKITQKQIDDVIKNVKQCGIAEDDAKAALATINLFRLRKLMAAMEFVAAISPAWLPDNFRTRRQEILRGLQT